MRAIMNANSYALFRIRQDPNQDFSLLIITLLACMYVLHALVHLLCKKAHL